jgi:hypothetical protein
MKKLNELSKEELLKVYEINEKLQHEVIEDYQEDTIDFTVGEMLDYLRKSLNNWSIGFYQNNYITISDNKLFLEGVLKATKNNGLLDETEKETILLINKIIEKIDIFEGMDWDNNNYDKLEAWIEEKVELIRCKVLKEFNTLTTIDYNYMEEYFIEVYVEERMDKDDYYINDNYELFKHIEYEKSYLSFFS